MTTKHVTQAGIGNLRITKFYTLTDGREVEDLTSAKKAQASIDLGEKFSGGILIFDDLEKWLVEHSEAIRAYYLVNGL
jgi:hypothetical protein